MKDAANIKRLRTQSLLKELIGEALGSLDDPLLSGQLVVDVECKKGRYDAFVFLDKQDFSAREQEAILSRLKRCAKVIEGRCLAGLGMYRCPNLHFSFDESLEKINRIEALFAQIEAEKAAKGASTEDDDASAEDASATDIASDADSASQSAAE